MSNCTVVSDGAKSLDRWFLHGNSQESGKYSFHGGSLIVDIFESPSVVTDFLPNTGGQTNEDVATFLFKEFRVACRAKEISSTKFF